MQRVRRSLFVLAAVAVTLSLTAAPRETKPPRAPSQADVQQKQTSTSPWTRLIRKILDDVIPPPPDNRGSIPPG